MTTRTRTRRIAPAVPAPEESASRRVRTRRPEAPAAPEPLPVEIPGSMTVSKAMELGLIKLDHDPDREYSWSDKVDYPQIIARYKDNATSYKTAIRAACVDCMGGLVQSIQDCCSSPDTENPCPLWPFRMGENPFDARTIKAASKKK